MQIQQSPRHSKRKLFASLPLFISLLMITIPFSNVFADTEYKVQSGDSLSKIISRNYPDVAKQSYGIIMQHTLKNNPDAFSNKNINSLRLGKTLTLTDKEDIEGLKPKPPAPVPVNPEEFKKLQSQNSDLKKQLQAVKAELEKRQSSSTESTNTTTSVTSTAEDTANQEEVKSLRKKVEQLLTQVKTLEAEKQALTESGNDLARQTAQLTAAKNLTKRLQSQITTLEEKNTELSKVDTSDIEKQLVDAQTEIAQLKKQITAFEAEKENQSKTDTDLATANKQVEALQTEVKQLKEKISQLEITDTEKDNNQAIPSGADASKLEEMQAEITLLQGLADKNEADMDEKDAKIKQLEEKLTALGGTEQNTGDTSVPSTDTNDTNSAQLEKLQKENSLLQAEVEKAIEKSSQDNDTIKQLKADLAAATTASTQIATTPPQAITQNTTTEAKPQSEPSTWLKLSVLSWLLPLLAILIGLYLLSHLIKRKRDKQATENFKTAMTTSASSTTASAFGIDGSAPAPHTNPDTNSNKPTIEEDSLEAGVKIDIAKAYIDLNEIDAANEMLQEAIIEGSSSQKETAEKLLK